MVLNLEPGETATRTLLIENVNNVSVTIQMTTSGELKDNIKLKENNFTLAPGESKKAEFTIKAKEEGTTENKIFVLFRPEEGNAVGLSSTIVVIAKEDSNSDNSDTSGEQNANETDTGFSFSPKTPTGNVVDSGTGTSISPALILTISTLVLVIALVVLVVFAAKKKGATKEKKSKHYR